MKKIAKTVVFSLFVLLTPLLAFTAPRPFYLQERQTLKLYGPFPVKSGYELNLKGKVYQLRIVGKDRLAFLNQKKEIYGPLQMVEGRLVSVDGSMYVFYQAKEHIRENPSRGGEKGNAPFIPPPPPKPELLPVEKETPHRVVSAKDLPELPSPVHRLSVAVWLAPIDDSKIDWKVSSQHGSDSSLERTTFGADVLWNSFSASVAFSPSVEGGDIVPKGVGILRSALEDGDGLSLQLGYHRPFLEENGWTASAGLRGAYRHDKVDLHSKSLTGSGVDTNGYVSADYVENVSSLTIDEYSLWLDVGLSFSQELWGMRADFSIQPLSDYKIDGDFIYGGKGYPVECERKTPIALSFGGWFDYRAIRFFGDVSFGSDERLRIGASYAF